MRIAMGRVLVLSVIISAFGGAPALAADEPFRVKPGALRRGESVTVTPTPRLDTSKGVMLKLSGPGSPLEFPIADARRASYQVTLPKDARQGLYNVEILNGEGAVLATGVRLKVLASDRPKITKITPHPSYPDDGRYSFEIHGEDFAYDVEDTDIKINGKVITFQKDQVIPDPKHKLTDDASCKGKFPCLIGNRRELKIYGLSLDKRFFRPMHVVVEVDSLESEDKPLILSQVPRNMPRVIAFVVCRRHPQRRR